MATVIGRVFLGLSLLVGGCSSAAFTGVDLNKNLNARDGDFEAANDGAGFGSDSDGANGGGSGNRNRQPGDDDSMGVGERNDGLGIDRSTNKEIDTSGAIGIEGNVPGGVRIPIKFYCSEDSAATIGTTASFASGITFKMFDIAGRLVAEDTDFTRAQARKNSIVRSKSAVLALPSMPARGDYYVALCDSNEHYYCGFKPVERGQPLDPNDGKGLRGVLGFVSVVRFGTNQMTYATRGAALFDLPKSAAEEAACDEVDSPLLVDMTGKGFTFTGLADGVQFDIDGDGFKERTAWTKSADSAFVALDLNGNGKVDGGGELFGNHTVGSDGKKSANGFLALAKHDANRDGVLDQRDPAYGKLWLWKDKNLNGVSESDELVGFATAGVINIKLTYVDARDKDTHGNEIRQRSQITFRKGSETWTTSIVDAWFKRSFTVSRRK